MQLYTFVDTDMKEAKWMYCLNTFTGVQAIRIIGKSVMYVGPE